MAYSTTIVKTQLKRKTGEATYELVEGAVPSGGPASTRNVNTWEPLSGPAIKKAGKQTFGSISVECPFDPEDASQANILAAIQDDTPAVDSWELGTSLATNPGLKFDGVITDYGLSFPNTGFATMKFSIGMASGVTPGAAAVVVPSPTFDPTVSDGATFSYGGVAVKGVNNFEITGLTRALVSSTAMDEDVPSGGPSSTRQRGNFSFDLLYDDSEVVHGTMLTDAGAKNTPKAMLLTLPNTGASTVGFSGCISSWDYSGVNTKDGKNTVKVTGYLTTDITVTA